MSERGKALMGRALHLMRIVIIAFAVATILGA